MGLLGQSRHYVWSYLLKKGPDLQAQIHATHFFWRQNSFGSPLAGLESEDWSPCLWNGDRPCCVTIDPAEGGGTCFGTGTMVNNGDMLEIPQFVGRFFCDLSYLLSCNSMAKARWFRPNKLYRTLFFRQIIWVSKSQKIQTELYGNRQFTRP